MAGITIAQILLSVVFACECVCGFAGFVFSPVHAAESAELPVASKWKAYAMAEELEGVLPASAEPPKQLEPAIEQAKEGDKEKESRGELLAAASLFNAASSEDTEEQQAAEDALRHAMSSPSRVGTPDRSTPENMRASCLPDFTKCPKGWNSHGVLCMAGETYTGRCAAEADLSDMSVEQKLAFANYCAVAFPCQEDCAQDFRQVCPSLWREVADGVCSAPLEYEGECSGHLEAADMSEESKYEWSIRCAARWPCDALPGHKYDDVCPKGWAIQLGKVCEAPPSYNGPCEHRAYMSGTTETEKKHFEAACHVDWPSTGAKCVHDYAAACPFGWYRSDDECIAPLMYSGCSGRKTFGMMTPAAKQEWASNCKVQFPCRGRDTCEKTYSTPCPADWYAFNGGMSCTAPSNYDGDCKPILHGLLHASIEEKTALEAKCQFAWPCAGETYASVISAGFSSTAPRLSTDPAQYSSVDGPIDSSSGAVRNA